LEGERRLNSAIRFIRSTLRARAKDRDGGREKIRSRKLSNGRRALAAATRCFLTAMISERKSMSGTHASGVL
jgi:hypothetical protein